LGTSTKSQLSSSDGRRDCTLQPRKAINDVVGHRAESRRACAPERVPLHLPLHRAATQVLATGTMARREESNRACTRGGREMQVARSDVRALADCGSAPDPEESDGNRWFLPQRDFSSFFVH